MGEERSGVTRAHHCLYLPDKQKRVAAVPSRHPEGDEVTARLAQGGRFLATTQDSCRLHNHPMSLEITFRDQMIMDEPHDIGIAGETELFANAWLAGEL